MALPFTPPAPAQTSAPPANELRLSASNTAVPTQAARAAPAPATGGSTPAPQALNPKDAVLVRAPLQTAREAMACFKNRYRGDDSKMVMSLTVTNSRSEQRSRQLVRYRKREDGLVQTVLSFVAPADEKGTTTLTVEQEKGDDLQWIYLLALKKLRRTASPDRGKA